MKNEPNKDGKTPNAESVASAVSEPPAAPNSVSTSPAKDDKLEQSEKPQTPKRDIYLSLKPKPPRASPAESVSANKSDQSIHQQPASQSKAAEINLTPQEKVAEKPDESQTEQATSFTDSSDSVTIHNHPSGAEHTSEVATHDLDAQECFDVCSTEHSEGQDFAALSSQAEEHLESDTPHDLLEQQARPDVEENFQRCRRTKSVIRELSLWQRLIYALRLDDYHKLTFQQRLSHFLWLIGFDTFPFRERGWALITLLIASLAVFIVYNNPLKWPIYRNWRASGFIENARKAIEDQHFSTAQLYLRNAYRHTPDNPELLRLWLNTIPADKNAERAAVLSQLYAMQPHGDTAAEIVEAMISARLTSQAAQLASRMLTQHPESARLWRAAGSANLILQKFHVATEAFKKALEINNGNDPNAEYHLALIDVLTTPSDQTPDFDRLEKFRQMPELRELSSRTLAAIYLSNNDNRAETLIDSVLSEQPGRWDFRFLRFTTRLNAEGSSNERLWEEIWRQADNLPNRMLIISEAIRRKELDIAESFLRRLDNIDREQPQTRWFELVVLIERQKWLDALRTIRETQDTLKLNKEWEAKFLAMRAVIQERLGNTAEARIAFNDAVRRMENFPQFNIFLGDMFMNFQMLDFARDSYQRAAIPDTPAREPALIRLYALYAQQNNWDKMVETITRLNTINPANNEYTSTLATLMIVEGRLHHPVIKNILSSDMETIRLGRDPMALVAHALAATGQRPKAAELIKRITPSANDDPRLRFHAASTLALCGKLEDATTLAGNFAEDPNFSKREIEYLNKLLSQNN